MVQLPTPVATPVVPVSAPAPVAPAKKSAEPKRTPK
jgi:hypothetical protein